MKKLMTTLLVTAGVLALSVAAEAQGRGMGPCGRGDGPGFGRGMGPGDGQGGHGMRGRGKGGHGAPMLGLNPCVVDSPELGLGDDQKAALKTLFEADGPQERQAFEAVRTRKQDLRALVTDPAATDAQIRAKAAEVHDLMQADRDARLERMLQARKILTPEQLAKVPEIRKACRGWRFDGQAGDRPFKGKRGRQGPRGQGPTVD